MIQRHITPGLLAALKDTPVILLNGARQSGKSTLVQWMIENYHPATYITLDDTKYLSPAISDPMGFIESFSGNLVIDEVQKAPGLFPVIKTRVDKKRTPGKYILTGSANIMTLPELSETLAGRMELLTMHTLSESEINGIKKPFALSLFSSPYYFKRKAGCSLTGQGDVFSRVARGGYPEINTRKSQERKDAWFNSYVITILQREIRDMANISGLIELPKLLSLIAARTSGIMNSSEISRSSGIPLTTLTRYLSLLLGTFLIEFLPSYSGSFSKRVVKMPKVYFRDTGLASYLSGFTFENKNKYASASGLLFENFVLMEIRKQFSSQPDAAKFFYYRTVEGKEIDLILENRSGRQVCIEIKSSHTVGYDDFKHIRWYMDMSKGAVISGFVFYTGNEIVPFGKNLFALPVKLLWETLN